MFISDSSSRFLIVLALLFFALLYMLIKYLSDSLLYRYTKHCTHSTTLNVLIVLHWISATFLAFYATEKLKQMDNVNGQFQKEPVLEYGTLLGAFFIALVLVSLFFNGFFYIFKWNKST